MAQPVTSSSSILCCYACQTNFQRSQHSLEYNEDGNACCPECGSEFVELLDEAPRPSAGLASAAAAGAQAAAQAASDASGRALRTEPAVARNPITGRGPRIEFHATFDHHPSHGARGPLSFVDAISRFAPVNLPNGQQAFVLQVQDGALLSPFTMGMPFGEAMALNPADWVVGDDLDAVVSRVLDAYMPPRRATSQHVRDTLSRLRVRPGPLSPRPTAGLELAAAAAETAAAAGRATNGKLPPRGSAELSAPEVADPAGAPEAAGEVAELGAAAAPGEVLPAATAAVAAEMGGGSSAGGGSSGPTAAPQQPVRVLLELSSGSSRGPGEGPRFSWTKEQEGLRSAEDRSVRLRLQLSELSELPAALATVTAVDTGAAEGSGASSSSARVAKGERTVCCETSSGSSGGGDDGYASCQPGELCTVCHDAFEAGGLVVELPCRHCFHEDCIMPWLQQQNTCPVCRKRLPEDRQGSGSSGSTGQLRQQPQRQPLLRGGEGPTEAAGGSAASDWANQAASGGGAAEGRDTVSEVPSSEAAPGTATAGAAASAAATSAEHQGRGRHQPSQPPQPWAPGARPLAEPLLGGFAPRPSMTPPHPESAQPFAAAQQQQQRAGGLSREALETAEAALAPLRTRFPPLSLDMHPVPQQPVVIPLTEFLTASREPAGLGSILRGPHGPRSRSARSPQPASGRTNPAPALRAGFLNQAISLYGIASPAAPVAQARGADGGAGTRSALRGGFFNNALSAGGGGSTLAPQQPRVRRTAPALSVGSACGERRAASSRGDSATRQATGPPAVSGDSSSKADVEGAAGVAAAAAAAGGKDVQRPELQEAAAAAVTAADDIVPGSVETGGEPSTLESSAAAAGSDAEGLEEGERYTRQVARRSRQQDAASLAHSKAPAGDSGSAPPPGANVRVTRARVVRKGKAAAVALRGAATAAPVSRETGSLAADPGSAAASREGAGMAVTAAAASRGSAQSGGGDGHGVGADAAEAGGAGQRHGGGGVGGGGRGFNPVALVVGGAGAGLRFLGGLVLRGGR